MRLARKWRRCERGGSIAEFAIVVPVFLYLLFFSMETSLIFFSAVTIEDATLNAVRQSKIGDFRSAPDDADEIEDYIRDHAYGLIDEDNLYITTNLQDVTTGASYSNSTVEFCKNPDGTQSTQTCPCEQNQLNQFFDNNGNGVCDMGPPSLALGGPGAIIDFRVVYNWKVLTPGLGALLGGDGGWIGDDRGNFLIQSGISIRNEPF